MRILKKYENNPVMSPDKMPKNVLYTFNPGAIYHNGQYILMMDVTGTDDIHRLWIARSADGYNFVPDGAPVRMPPPDPFHPEMNTYDPRITKIGDEYIILYASDLLQNDARIGILKTRDFEKFERVCTGSELGNRNGALFPEKYKNLYFRLDRPFGNELEPCSMWMSFSPDLCYWGNARPVMYKGKPFTDGFKMGAGAVPVKTDAGWLEIYHTVSTTCNGFIYRLKACILDTDEPWNILGYTKDFILWPEHDYEMRGRVSNVVFTCNALVDENGRIKIYYGAADTNIGLAEGNVDDIVRACMES